jgi:hypothetical protein
LISGQASVLYGGATFSEDIDIWVRPLPDNVRRMLRALASCRARVYKLTPPITVRFLNAGHGFHFTLSDASGVVYLDVMGRPPRVGSFPSALARAQWMETSWGRLPVVSIEDLILLKQTRRLSDYEVISNLTRLKLESEPRPAKRLLKWAVRNCFQAEQRLFYLGRLGMTRDLETCRREIGAEIARLQARDVRYWRPKLSQLRMLSRSGKLLSQGFPVSKLCP